MNLIGVRYQMRVDSTGLHYQVYLIDASHNIYANYNQHDY